MDALSRYGMLFEHDDALQHEPVWSGAAIISPREGLLELHLDGAPPIILSGAEATVLAARGRLDFSSGEKLVLFNSLADAGLALAAGRSSWEHSLSLMHAQLEEIQRSGPLQG